MGNQTEIKQNAIVQDREKSALSQRFFSLVVREFGETAVQGMVNMNERQKRLIQGYFIIIDKTLQTAEQARIKKNENNRDHKYDNVIPYDWNHVNMVDLALDAAHFARMGLDMQEKNHLFPIPYANKKTSRYDISFTVGYSGVQYIAEKYAITPPRSVTIEVVYSTDIFKPMKKCRLNSVETYDFEITQPFDRGEIIGGFGYIEYDDPSKNELVIMSLKDIMKRAGKNANPEFWGSEITGKKVQVWENGNKTWGDAEGWLDEMVRKTIIREVYSSKHIPRDPSKIDDDYQHLQERKVIYAQQEIDSEATENANTTPIDIQQPTPQELPQAPIGVDIRTNAEPEAITQEQQTPPPITEEYEEPDF